MRAGWLVAALLVTAACDGSQDGPGPVIDAVTPSLAAAGARIDVLGSGFCGTPVGADGDCAELLPAFVSFGGGADVVRAETASWSDDRIVLAVPAAAAAGATLVVVTIAGVPSNPVDFEVE